MDLAAEGECLAAFSGKCYRYYNDNTQFQDCQCRVGHTAKTGSRDNKADIRLAPDSPAVQWRTCRGAAERPAPYTLSVEKAGYRPEKLKVKVESNACHVITVPVKVVLKRVQGR